MASAVYQKAYEEALKTLAQPYGGASSAAFQNALKTGEITNENFVNAMTALGYAVETYTDSTTGKTFIKDVSTTTIDAAPSDNAVSVINSNTQTGTSGAGTQGSFYTQQPFATESGGAGEPVKPADIIKYKNGEKQTGGAQNVGNGTKILKVAGGVVQGIIGYGTGLNLGKIVEKEIYSAEPDFWDAKGLSSLDPDTWSEISRDIESPAGRVAFNLLAGTETAEDGTTTATLYAEDTAQAYFAKWLQSVGFLDSEEQLIVPTATGDAITVTGGLSLSDTVSAALSNISVQYENNTESEVNNFLNQNSAHYGIVSVDLSITTNGWSVLSIAPYTNIVTGSSISGLNKDSNGGYYDGYAPKTDSLNCKGYYSNGVLHITETSKAGSYPRILVGRGGNSLSYQISSINTEIKTVGMTGVSDQQDGTVFDPAAEGLTDDSTVEDWKNAMKEVLPDLWNNRIEISQAQPDGTTKTFIYIPLPLGQYLNTDNSAQPYNDPTQQGQKTPQTQPQIDPKTATDTQIATLLEALIRTIAQTPTGQPDPTVQPAPTGYVVPETDPKTTIKTTDPPTNPPDTGDGDTPTVVMPTGKASSLWAIYNPTLEQINSFGSWLWSSDFIDQILKLFSDPMQAIIGIHKIYCTPITGETRNIKVGYLDSGVSSKIVTEQYTTVDCGSINLFEYFGNVFDYAPYTELRLYLPFIGIVNLDTADAMRGVIHVVYHVDVLSGACLAEVQITRDAAGGTLYQFAGNAAVTMPISSGSYIGVIANVVGVASSAIGGFASGGVAGGIAGGVTGALTRRGGTQVEHSGNFSGNAGAMGIKKPYLIIERPQTALADNYAEYIGNPSNQTVVLSSCTGYIKVKEVHLENVPATGAELSEIEQNLKQGVII